MTSLNFFLVVQLYMSQLSPSKQTIYDKFLADPDKLHTDAFKNCIYEILDDPDPTSSQLCEKIFAALPEHKQDLESLKDFVYKNRKNKHELYKKCVKQVENDEPLSVFCEFTLYKAPGQDKKVVLLQNEQLADYSTFVYSFGRSVGILFLMAKHQNDCFILGNVPASNPYEHLVIKDATKTNHFFEVTIEYQLNFIKGPEKVLKDTLKKFARILPPDTVYNPEEQHLEWLTMNMKVPPYVGENIAQCMNNSNKHFIIIPLTLDDTEYTMSIESVPAKLDLNEMKKAGEGEGFIHHNVLIFDKWQRTLERYDPHGSQAPYDMLNLHDILDKKMEVLLRDYLKPVGIHGFSYVGVMQICPRQKGFQHLEDMMVNKWAIYEKAGLCVMWTLFYIDLRLTFRDMDRDTLLDKVTSDLSLKSKFKEFIMIYSLFFTHVYRQIVKVIKKSNKKLSAAKYSHLSDAEKVGKTIEKVDNVMQNFALIYGAGAELSRKKGWQKTFKQEIGKAQKKLGITKKLHSDTLMLLEQTYLNFESIDLDMRPRKSIQKQAEVKAAKKPGKKRKAAKKSSKKRKPAKKSSKKRKPAKKSSKKRKPAKKSTKKRKPAN